VNKGDLVEKSVVPSHAKNTWQQATGREGEVTIPLDWFAKLRDASIEEKSNWRLIGKGEGIHWENLDKDILVEP
jgi:hypothetical protein